MVMVQIFIHNTPLYIQLHPVFISGELVSMGAHVRCEGDFVGHKMQ